MAKAKSESLFRLIQSLTPSEKRSFRLWSGRFNKGEEKKYLVLFDALECQKQYDESVLLKKAPQINPQQLSNLKANLYQQILRSLEQNASNQIVEIKITEMIDHSRILYNRCLYRECLEMIDKTKKRAIANDSFLLLLEILELEKLALGRIVENVADKRVEEIVAETNSTAAAIRNINTFSNLALRLNNYYHKIGFIRNGRDLERVNQLFFSSLPEYEEQKMSFHEKLYLYYSYTGYSFFTQDFHQGYEYARKWVDLFEENPEMIVRKTELYIRALNSLLVVQNKLYLYHEFMQTHRKLVALKRNKNLELTENINLNLFKAIYIHEINRHFMLGEFKSGTRVVAKLEKELHDFIPKLDANTVMIFYYKIACLYFGAGNFRTSVKWLNLIIQQYDDEVREDIQSFARILRLICYFEMEDDDMLEYSIRSTYRYLLEKKSFVKYQRHIMQFLKGLRRTDTPAQIVNSFVKLKSRIKQLTRDPYEKRAFIYFDIISWLESKIEDRPVQEVIKEKAGRLNRNLA
jgi:hypothetical protein